MHEIAEVDKRTGDAARAGRAGAGNRRDFCGRGVSDEREQLVSAHWIPMEGRGDRENRRLLDADAGATV